MQKRQNNKWITLLTGIVLVGLLHGCSKSYYAEEIEAWVVDADTKQPLEGVIVTANWQLEEGTLGGNIPKGQLMVMETVTDKNGRFYFPKWGPKKAPEGHLVNRDPQLLLFKAGYEYEGLENTFTQDYNKSARRVSEWHGKTIELRKFEGDLKEYAGHLGFLRTSLDSIIRDDCGWKRIPKMIIAIDKQSNIFRKQGLFSLSSIESLDVTYKNKCGSVKKYFEGMR